MAQKGAVGTKDVCYHCWAMSRWDNWGNCPAGTDHIHHGTWPSYDDCCDQYSCACSGGSSSGGSSSGCTGNLCGRAHPPPPPPDEGPDVGQIIIIVLIVLGSIGGLCCCFYYCCGEQGMININMQGV